MWFNVEVKWCYFVFVVLLCVMWVGNFCELLVLVIWMVMLVDVGCIIEVFVE